MKFIRIAHVSGGQVLYTSFSFDSFSEIKSQEDSVFLFFNSLIDNGFVTGENYYGTRVEFNKSNLGYQLYGEILQQISKIQNTSIVTLDYTDDPLVTLNFTEIYGPYGGGGGGTGASASNYGYFYDTQDQNNDNSSNAFTFGVTGFANGISIQGATATQVTFQNAGDYFIELNGNFSASNTTDSIDIWLTKNGSEVPYTLRSTRSYSSSVSVILSWNLGVTVNAGDYIELLWSSADSSAYFYGYQPPSPPYTGGQASIILSVYQPSGGGSGSGSGS